MTNRSDKLRAVYRHLMHLPWHLYRETHWWTYHLISTTIYREFVREPNYGALYDPTRPLPEAP